MRELCKKEKIKVTADFTKAEEEFESTKKGLSEELCELFKHNKFDPLKSPTDLKYKLEMLEKGNKDYKLLKKSLGLDLTDEQTVNDVKGFTIYKVKPADNSENKSDNPDGSNLLLLHGTEGKNVKGILKGFVKLLKV